MASANKNATDLALTPLRSLVLPELHVAQHRDGYVSDQAMRSISRTLRMTVNAIEGIATSYPEIRRKPAGTHLIRICSGTPCWIAGSSDMLTELEDFLGISAGETTEDGIVTLETIPCCFVCAQAPAVELDGQIRSDLKTRDLTDLINASRLDLVD